MEKREVIKARDVIFFENSFERTESNNNTDEFNVNVFAPVSEIENDDVPDSKHEKDFETASDENTADKSERENDQHDDDTDNNSSGMLRGREDRR